MTVDSVDLLLAHIDARLGPGPHLAPPGWSHIGADISDSVLQAGLRYDTVVRPAIERLLAQWPDADTVTRFRNRLAAEEVRDVLHINNARKLTTIAALADHLAAEGVDTCSDLKAWLEVPEHRSELLAIKGVGPKTVDYLCMLVGIPSAAVDRHLRRFAEEAGVELRGYDELKALYEEAADRLGEDRTGLEHAVWEHMAER